MLRFRPRISILTALLLMTILGMAIVLVRQWREVGPLRAEVRRLRDETGRLSIEDSTKVHAMQVRTSEPLCWKWRVWVPVRAKVTFHTQWGSVPRTGIPSNCPGDPLEPGEQWITMRVVRDPVTNGWFAKYETPTSGSGTPIKDEDCWFNWSKDAMMSQGVQFQTGVQLDPSVPLILTRYRTVPSGNSDDLNVNASTAGFIIWLERQ